MNKTNISSVVKFEAKDSIKTYMERINEHEKVNCISVDKMNQSKNVFSGEERKLSFNVKNHDSSVPVRVYFTVPLAKDNKIMMDVFTSATGYMDMFEYEETLISILKDVVQAEFSISYTVSRTNEVSIKI